MALQSPEYFKHLETGSTFVRIFEEQKNEPLESNSSSIRGLSPFTIQVVPPLFLGQGIASGGPNDAYSKSNLGGNSSSYGLYSSAYSEVNYRDSVGDVRKRLASTGELVSGFTERQNALKQYVYNGLLNLTTNQIVNSKNKKYKTGEAQFADSLYAAEIFRQLEVIAATPPLVLLINPMSFSVSYSKIAQYGDRTRKGYVYQYWGEEQPTISITCKIGAFVAGQKAQSVAQALATGESVAPSGVQFASKRDSAAYQQLMDIMTIYRNGGLIHDTVSGFKNFLMVGAIQIEYDQNVYIGHMNSFSYAYNDSENMNGGVEFEFEFTVNRQYDVTNDQATFVRPMVGPQNPTDNSPTEFLNPSTSTSRFSNNAQGLTGGESIGTASFERNTNSGLTNNSDVGSQGFSSATAETEEEPQQGLDFISNQVQPFGV